MRAHQTLNQGKEEMLMVPSRHCKRIWMLMSIKTSTTVYKNLHRKVVKGMQQVMIKSHKSPTCPKQHLFLPFCTATTTA
jgi:hypothetical protein